jgi:hypothetical protein
MKSIAPAFVITWRHVKPLHGQPGIKPLKWVYMGSKGITSGPKKSKASEPRGPDFSGRELVSKPHREAF